MHDSHIHMALEPLKSNTEEVVKDFKNDNGKYILTQGTDIDDFQDTLDISKKYPNTIFAALGIHPTFFEENILCKDNCDDMLSISKKYIKKFEDIFLKNIKNLKAVGETGLDYFQAEGNGNLTGEYKGALILAQKESLRKHIVLALEYDLPLSIHSREERDKNQCVKDTLEMLATLGRGKARGSFHSYTGDVNMVRDILDLGFYIGFNAILTYPSGENVREILKMVPEDRILFETDGPFLPPQSIRKNKKLKEKYAKPSHVREILEVAAEVKGIDSKRLENIADENFERLFL